MVGCHHQLNGHGFRWTLGVGDGQGGLACCSSWGRKELDTTEHAHTDKLAELSEPQLPYLLGGVRSQACVLSTQLCVLRPQQALAVILETPC